MKVLGFAVVLTLLPGTAAAFDAAEAMSWARESASSVSTSGLVTEVNASNTVAGWGADVSEIKSHYMGGQGSLIAPGTSKVESCLNASSMDCRAVQTVLNSGSAPGFDESKFEDILSGAEDIKGGVSNVPGDSSGVICETIKTEHKPQTEFRTCENTQNSEYKNCFSGWSSSMEFETLFKCVSRTQKVHTVTCENPYVSSIADYTCVEAPRQSCVLGTAIDVKKDYLYKCRTQKFKKATYRCNRVLDVVGFAGCEPGSLQSAQASDPAHLGQDACNGGDIIDVKFACSDASPPLLRIETNVKNAANFGFDIQAFDFDVEKTFSNCKGRWKGKTRCTGTSCVSEITMDVFYSSKGTYKYSGSLRKIFAYQTYSHSAQADVWKDACVPLDGNTLEAP